jgi:hypothetical protein
MKFMGLKKNKIEKLWMKKMWVKDKMSRDEHYLKKFKILKYVKL